MGRETRWFFVFFSFFFAKKIRWEYEMGMSSLLLATFFLLSHILFFILWMFIDCQVANTHQSPVKMKTTTKYAKAHICSHSTVVFCSSFASSHIAYLSPVSFKLGRSVKGRKKSRIAIENNKQEEENWCEAQNRAFTLKINTRIFLNFPCDFCWFQLSNL